MTRRTLWIPVAAGLLLLFTGLGWWGWDAFAQREGATSADAAKAGAAPHGGGGRGGGEGGGRGGGGGGGRPVPVVAATIETGDIRVVQNAVGTVVPRASVVVRSRVGGQLLRVLFEEGQLVRQGQLLAEIDPRPFQAQLAQVEGQARRNEALLKNAQSDLERYRSLEKRLAVSDQQIDAQVSLVRQYEGAVQTDRGLVEHARLQVEFTRITAPIGGRIGLRRVDAGNTLVANDDTGLAVINQVQPISVVFTLPEDRLSALVARFDAGRKAGESLRVEAWDRGSRNLLATGDLLSIDNQIDATSGTVRLKAQFANTDGSLYPNQFVNARLVLETLRQVPLVPQAAIQRGSIGAFVYAVDAEDQVSVRPLALGPADGDRVVVEKGLEAGEVVVVSGTDRLRAGARITRLVDAASGGKGGPREGGREGKRPRAAG